MNGARILVVDDEPNIRELLDEILSEEGYDVTTAEDAEHARTAYREQNYDLTLLDIWMPDSDGISLLKEWSEAGALGPVVMMSGHGTVDTAVEATRLGALDFIEKPVSLTKLLRTVEKALSGRRTGELRRTLVPPALAPLGKSDLISGLRDQVSRIARYETPALFIGEPGSGRQLLARFLASRSTRSGGQFIVVEGADLTEDKAAERLTGGQNGPGALAAAEGGTLYVRNLHAASVAGQRHLTRILDARAWRPYGADRDRPLNTRILAGLLPEHERDGTVREELMEQLGSVVVRVPALRDYAEDVPELLRYHVDLLVDAESLPFRRFGVAAQNRLRNYPWPGNVRELRNLVKRMLIMGGDETIELAEVEAELDAETPSSEPLFKQDLLAMPLREAREHFERAYLEQQLTLCGGKVGKLSKRVGMERTHLYRKLRSLGVDFRQAGSDD